MTIRVLQLPLGPLQTNCYVLACTITNQAAVIDPSWDGRTIAHQVTSHGWSVAKILLTHTHFDHVGGLGVLKETSGAPIYVHEEAVEMLERAPAAAAMWGYTVEPTPVADHYLREGDVIEVGELRVDVLYTPGHAPGHVCFHLPVHHILFDGDVLFQGSIGRTDLPGGDFDLLMANIDEKIMILPDETIVLSGHGAATTIGDERRTNPFLVR